MDEVPQHLFSSAVAGYARYRTGYPPHDVAALAALLGLDRTHTVLDVGCGTGQLAIPLARFAGSVIAIDPVAEMLAVGRLSAERAGTTNVTWVLGDASGLETLAAPGARAASFAASFHWTDRPEVVRTLDQLIAPGGSIVTINDDLGDDEDPDWVRAITELRGRYLGERHGEPTDAYRNPPDSHRTVFGASAFSDVRALMRTWTRELTVDEAVGLQFTYSFSTPALFGDRADAFAADARAAILARYPHGRVTEPLRMEVLIASRPTR